MRRFFPLCFLLTVYSSLLWGQTAPFIEWQKCLGGSGVDQSRYIEPTTDGGYIITGTTESNNGHVTNHQGTVNAQNIWVVKTNSAGAIEWQKAIGSSTGFYWGSVVHQTSDGGYVVSGASADNTPFTDYYLAKLNSTGTILWEKKYGGDKSDYCNSMQITKDGGFILAGYSESNNGNVSGSHGNKDFWVVKVSSTGILEWQQSLGGTGNDEAFSVQVTWDLGYIVVGKTESNNGNVSGNHGGVDSWVVKLSSTGTMEWQKCMGGSNAEEAWSVQQTPDLGYVIAGYTASNDNDVSGNHGVASGDYWVVKLNSTGTMIWQKCLGGVLSDEAFFIQNTEDGGFIVAGTTNSFDGDVTCNAGTDDYWIVKLNGIGAIQWQKSLGGLASDVAFCVQPTVDKGYIVTGRTCSFTFPDYHQGSCGDFFVVKLSGPVNAQLLNVNIVPHEPVVCNGVPFTLVATTYYNAGQNPVWQWKRNGVVVPALGNTTYTASDFKENDTIICTVSIPANCNSTVTTVSDTVVIKVNPSSTTINITADANNACIGTNITFTAAATNTGATPTYQWKVNNNNAGSNSSVFSSTTLKNGDKVHCELVGNVNVCSNHSVISNTITLAIFDVPVITMNPASIDIKPGQSAKLNATVTGSIGTFEWSPIDKLLDPSSLTPTTIALTNTTAYRLRVVSPDECAASESVTVRVLKPLIMPNAFSPNNDRINNVFRISPDVSIKLEEFSIFDRWGNKVFTTKDTNKGWDGTFHGKESPPGLYVYIIKGTGENGKVQARGTVMLVR